MSDSRQPKQYTVEDVRVPFGFKLLTVVVCLLACGVFAWVAYAMNLMTTLTGYILP